MKRLLFLLILLLLPIRVSAQNITNPQIVNEMRVNIVEKGFIDLNGTVYNLELNVSIPQEDEYQKMEQFDVEDSFGPCKTEFCSYRFVLDKYGNKLLNIKWKDPVGRVNYTVDSTVSVTKRGDIEKKNLKEFIEPTSLVQSTDSEIVKLASNARGNDFDKVSYLAKWIGENIQYDTVYSDVNLSAKEILSIRKGVCKEFSNLLVSFLRDLGYHSAVAVGYVYPGRVYEASEFQPHGWTEVYADKGIVADPVWSEVGYLDATHIKFATLPDSSWTFTSVNANGLGTIGVKLSENDVKLKIIDFTEKPLINVTTSLLSNNIWANYSVLRTDLKADGCFLTKIEYKSCSDEVGNDFLSIVEPQNIVYFCNERSVFTIFKIPPLDERKSYRCDIRVFPYAGKESTVRLVLNPKGYGYSKLSVEKNVLKPGESFSVNARNSQIFTDYGEYGYEKAKFTAPNYDFKVYSYNSGYLDRKNISVVLVEPIEVSLDVNDTAFVGKPTLIRVKVVNLLNTSQHITIIFKKDSYSDTLTGSKDFVFNFTPQSVDDNLVQVFVNTPDFSTSVSDTVTVVEQKTAIENFFQPLIDFFNWLLSLFR
jgi:transglutaminase-like putative cysteine protease